MTFWKMVLHELRVRLRGLALSKTDAETATSGS
jgi:hypothetical protein